MPAPSARVSFLIFTGDEIAAAQACLEARDPEDFQSRWPIFSAVYAGNKAAIASLQKSAADSNPNQAIAWLRALAYNAQFEPLAHAVASCKDSFNLPPWFVARLTVEYRFETDPASLAKSLTELLSNDAIPRIHRAEILYNIGVARARQGDHAAAREAYERAQELNPLLELPT